VVFDWLEDCLISTVKTKKLLRVKPYTLDRTIARINKGKTDHEKYRRQFEEGVQASKELCDNSKSAETRSCLLWPLRRSNVIKGVKRTYQYVGIGRKLTFDLARHYSGNSLP
jgi:hypothetical protein